MKKQSKNIIVLLLGIIIILIIKNQIMSVAQKTIVKKVYKNNYAVPINVPTRGIEDYKQIGIISSNEGKVLPLYGRRTYYGSQRWNYFTKANDHLSVKIPLVKDGKDCDSNLGCKELYDNDIINVPQYGDDFTLKLYDTTPRYIPFT